MINKSLSANQCSRQIIPTNCLNQWSRVVLSNGEEIWFYPTAESGEYIFGYVAGNQTNKIVCGEQNIYVSFETGTLSQIIPDQCLNNWVLVTFNEGQQTWFYLSQIVNEYLYGGLHNNQFKEVKCEPSTQTLDINGSWVSTYGQIDFNQMGSIVTGKYSTNGFLEGVLLENNLAGKWEETPFPSLTRNGYFEFIFSSDGNSFTGKWGYDEKLDGGEWNGSRI